MAILGITGSEEAARLHHGPKRHTLYDLVPESSADPHLGPFPCDHQSRGARNQNQETRQELGRIDARVRSGEGQVPRICAVTEVTTSKIPRAVLERKMVWSFNTTDW